MNDELMKECRKPDDVMGENGLLKQLTKAIPERARNAELTEHVSYEKHDPARNKSGNSHIATSAKTVKDKIGEMVVETPRDRNGTFEPKILALSDSDCLKYINTSVYDDEEGILGFD